jgi:hypothetical protein
MPIDEHPKFPGKSALEVKTSGHEDSTTPGRRQAPTSR